MLQLCRHAREPQQQAGQQVFIRQNAGESNRDASKRDSLRICRTDLYNTADTVSAEGPTFIHYLMKLDSVYVQNRLK